ncbi:MAG: hypothetical protein A2X42_04305 [Candidatus Margulisbacteria bacterium GWF2_38_17]|nr:MAG: hypothetical protein A2X43_11780 [Candidatus Margulisbacteria bacterium GWD2_39_127]OGI01820.1 MAG: hypothetical protein A2X42_04305 [Candidatus Margulisbacteria bacterium GWF2_38_17]OGI10142.1 MAG: hypothetical protein A2X41_01025 [Candidatus Margulisbacteria bacterium GWE2_39_32]
MHKSKKEPSLVPSGDVTKAEDFIASVADVAGVIIIIIDSIGKIIGFNRYSEKLTGYTYEELTGKDFCDVFFPKDQVDFEKKIVEGYLYDDFASSQENCFLTKDGNCLRISWKNNIVYNGEGSVSHVIYIGVDITEFKIIEEQLVGAHKEIEQLLMSISAILIGIDTNETIVRWNKQAESALGYDVQTMLGQKLLRGSGILWDWEVVEEAIYVCKQSNQSKRLDNVMYIAHGDRERYLRIMLYPVQGENGLFKELLILADDVTELRELQGQLVQAQKLEAIGQLAAGIAHEINTPTQYVGDNTLFLRDSFNDMKTLINKYQELMNEMKKGAVPDSFVQEIEALTQKLDIDYLMDEVPRAIDQTLEGINRVSTIVRAMKEFSHPGSTEMVLVDINRAIESTITVSRNEWKYVSDLVTDFDNTLPLVNCFPGEFNQAVLNIIINAAHAIGDKVGDGDRGKGAISISTKGKETYVEIRISDTGMGIPGEIVDRIFDPFFTTKGVGKGTGQGLSIARSVIVDKHKGSIKVETELGIGTTFVIQLSLQS